jgi:hypothetical protein
MNNAEKGNEDVKDARWKETPLTPQNDATPKV